MPEPETTVPEAGAPETAAPQFDTSGIEEAIGRLDSRFNAIEQAIPQQQPEPQPDPDAWIDDYAHLLGEPEPEPAQADPREALRTFGQIADQRAQQQLQQNVSPQLQHLEQRIAEMQARDDLRELQQKLPDLQKPEVHDAVAEIVNAQMSHFPPGVPATKEMIESAYKAYMFDQMAAGEGSAQPNPQLESPTGAGPEGAEPDWNARVMQGQARTKGTDFWGFDAL